MCIIKYLFARHIKKRKGLVSSVIETNTTRLMKYISRYVISEKRENSHHSSRNSAPSSSFNQCKLVRLRRKAYACAHTGRGIEGAWYETQGTGHIYKYIERTIERFCHSLARNISMAILIATFCKPKVSCDLLTLI